MNTLEIHGYPLNSREAVLMVIKDMKVTSKDPSMKLSMIEYAHVRCGICHACAGGSAVIHGMGASRYSVEWNSEETMIAEFYDHMREGRFDVLNLLGYPIPNKAIDTYDYAMRFSGDPKFWTAWRKFAMALPLAKELSN